MMYKPTFNQRKVFRFHRFARKGYALFACLGHVVTIGVLSVATLTTASAAIDHKGVVADGATTTSATTDDTPDKEATLEDVEVTGSRAPLALGQAVRMVTVLSREDIQAAPVQSINDLLKYAAGVDVRQRGPIGAQTDISIRGGTSEQITILRKNRRACKRFSAAAGALFAVLVLDKLTLDLFDGYGLFFPCFKGIFSERTKLVFRAQYVRTYLV